MCTCLRGEEVTWEWGSIYLASVEEKTQRLSKGKGRGRENEIVKDRDNYRKKKRQKKISSK